MAEQQNNTATRCLHVVRFAVLELRDALGRAVEQPTAADFLDSLSYLAGDRIPYTGRAQSLDARGNVSAEGYFREGRPEGLWTRWHPNGKMREQFHIDAGQCRFAKHWDTDGFPL
jgi:hypothetical protein